MKLFEHPVQASGHAAEIILLKVEHAPTALGEFPLHDLNQPLLHRVEVLPRERWRAHEELFAQGVTPIAALGLPDLKGTFTGQCCKPAWYGALCHARCLIAFLGQLIEASDQAQ